MLAPNRPIRLRFAPSRVAPYFKSAGSLRTAALLTILFGVLAITFYSPSSATSFRKSMDSRATSPQNMSRISGTGAQGASQASLLSLRKGLNLTPLTAPFFVEGIATFSSDCATPKTDFNLGDVVCAKASGVPVTLFPWHVLWLDPDGNVRQADQASTNDATQYLFTVPASATSSVNGQIVDNRGTWQVNLVRSNGAVRQTARFVVHEPANPVTDLFVQKINRSSDGSVFAGGNIDFIIVVGNAGPDTAADVHLLDSLPSGATLTSFTQTFGPTCAPIGDGPANDCIIATLANGARAEFTAIYNVGAAAPGTYQTSASVSSAATVPPTVDPDTNNNTSTAQYTVTSGGGGTACELICPDHINAVANTTEGGIRGAHVTYAEPVTSGDCGEPVSSTPASGSFFPVGTTTVSATSNTGGGSCSFNITVVDQGSDPPTISCPANPPAGTADGTCSASVTVGTATASGGSNVTFFATRSDGRPMYNCDANGNCTRRSPDDPFQAGETTITWFAYSHDVAGPYTTPGPPPPPDTDPADTFEEQHRTGTAVCTQTVTVNDVTPPNITAPANQTGSADSSCMFALPDYTSLATVSDNCACSSSDTSEICDTREPITITQSPAPGTMVGLGPHTITLTANDGSSNNGGAGNTANAQFTVTVNDTTPPTITAPADSSAFADANCQAPVPDYRPGTTSADNCGSVTLSQSPAPGTLVGYGPHTITVTANDGHGNTASDDVVFTVNDNTPPVFTSCPTNVTKEASCPTGAIATYATPTATDNCGVTVTRTAGPASGAVFPIGTTTVTHVANDGHGNTATCTFTVTVLTPQATLQSLINSVNASSLNGTQKNGLLAKLNAALDAINDGKTNIACPKLSDFVNSVGNLISNGSITAAQGNAWISSANHVRNVIGCTNLGCS